LSWYFFTIPSLHNPPRPHLEPQERAFLDFNWADDLGSISHKETAIPEHRIESFKLHHYHGSELLWDKETRVDKVFGSATMYGGAPEALDKVLERIGADTLINAREKLQALGELEEKRRCTCTCYTCV
jgi:hypothetical protein